jgi:hypothetical protein
MKYKVIPFLPFLDQKNPTAGSAAEQLQYAITKMATEGWSYVRLESVMTEVAPHSGCFGFGSKPGYSMSVQMLVFERVD